MPELIIPNPYIHSDKDEWTSWLTRRKDSIGSQPERVAEIIISIQRGVEFVRQKLSEDFPGFDIPKLGIVVFKNGEQSAVQFRGYYAELNMVGATADWLKQLGSLRFDQVYHEKPGNDQSVIHLSATPKDMALLFGMEEGHHAFLVQKGFTHQNPRVLPAEQYDALPLEFEALEFKVQHADELGLPLVTKACLMRRLEAAKKYRDQVV